MGKSQSVRQIAAELADLQQTCTPANFTDAEVAQIVSPQASQIRQSRTTRQLRGAIVFVALCGVAYALSGSETVNRHVIALTRIALIKVLPYWDWRHLKHEQCLLKLTGDPKIDADFNCDFCENVRIDVLEQATPTFLLTHYVQLHRPVVISSGLADWPLYKNNVSVLLDSPKLASSFPCDSRSNVLRYPVDFEDTLIRFAEFDEGFVHFRNCERDAVRAFRAAAPRPPFLPQKLSPVTGSWLMIGRNYEFAAGRKRLPLRESNAVFGVVKGSFVVGLSPRLNCEEECKTVAVEVGSGEALIITSLWDVSYEPHPQGENVAVVLEIR